MKYGELSLLVGGLLWFDLPMLVQAFPDQRPAIRLQLSRWIRQGKVVALRRGMYTLCDHARKVPLDAALLAQHLRRPSYLSSLWALGYHDMIPERVVVHTSVTSRLPAHYTNAYGVFDYRHIKPEAFFGYDQVAYGSGDLTVARPEKALLDHWHLADGEWTSERLVEMRYQNCDKVDQQQLHDYAVRFRSPRLVRAAKRWCLLASESDSETVIL